MWSAFGEYLHQQKPQTNADRIRAMSDEELMMFLFNEVSCGSICVFCVPTMRTKLMCDGHCKNGLLKWLQQPAQEAYDYPVFLPYDGS